MTSNEPLPRPEVRSGTVASVSIAILALGLVLRLMSARGDLWIDEIWSLHLLTKIRTPDEIFWNISHDNNHFLNSLWMFFVGVGQPSLLYRLPAIVMGTASIAVASRIGFRTSWKAGLLAGFVFAIAIPFVNYGSEARGYSGLILTLLLAIDAIDPAIPIAFDGACVGDFNRNRWQLGFAIGLGALFHLTMVLGAVILGLAAAGQLWVTRPPGSPWVVLRALVRLFVPSVLSLLPAVVAIAAGILVHGHFVIGGTSYAPGRFLTGFGGITKAVLGMPDLMPAWFALAIAALALLMAIAAKLLSPFRLWMAVMGLVVVPAVIGLSNPRNTDYPRYFLVCGVIAALIMAESTAGALLKRNASWVVVSLILLFTAGQIAQDLRLLLFGRGDVSRMVLTMAERSNATYAAPFSTAYQLAIDYHAAIGNLAVERVDVPWACNAAPDWYVFDGEPTSSSAPAFLPLGPPDCLTQFAQVLDVPTSSLSGRHWTLFSRQD